MSTSTLVCDKVTSSRSSRVADFVELTKPKIAILELLTISVAACVAAGLPNWWLLLHTLFGTTLVAASASALNQWLEKETDRLMRRTANRPLPAMRLSSRDVLVFAWLTIFVGTLYLALMVNWETAGVGLVTWLLYVWIYTPLKRLTPLNTVVGAVAGALPVLMGWTCMSQPLDLHAASLFLVVFLWQFPHFMAIAWLYRKEYGVAGMKMLPVVDPTGRRAGAQAAIAALALVPVSLIPAMLLLEPIIFLLTCFIGFIQFFIAYKFMINTNEQTARRLLRMSLVYLPLILILLMLVPVI